MLNESSFSIDRIAHQGGILANVDARIKLVFTLLYLFVVLLSSSMLVPLTLIIVLGITLIFLEAPKKLILGRLIIPMIMAISCLMGQGLIYGQETLYTLSLGKYQFAIYNEGLIHGSLVAVRIMATVMMVLILSLTTPFNELLAAARWLKIPSSLIEIAMFTYRYLFLLWEEVIRIYSAQKMRLGYPRWYSLKNWKVAMSSASTLIGMLLIRAFDRAGSSHEAMCLRGYRGNLQTLTITTWSKKQLIETFVFTTILVVLIRLNY